MSKVTTPRILAAVGGLALLGVLAWASLGLGASERGEPLWTEQDLPQAPPAASNGWLLVADHPLEDHDAELLGSALGSFEELEGEAFWARMRDPEGSAAARRELMASASARESLALVESARERERFVVRCVPLEKCPIFDWHQLHELALTRVIDWALAGEEGEALALTADLLRMDRSLLVNASSWLQLVVALSNLEATLAVADALASRQGDPGQDPTQEPALAEIAAHAQLIPEQVDLRPVVIGEYLFVMSALDQLDESEGELPGPRWLFDRAGTEALINARFEGRHAAAGEGEVRGALGADEGAATDRFGWWMRNAVGKRTIDAMTPELESLAQDIEDDLAKIEALRARLLSRPAMIRAG